MPEPVKSYSISSLLKKNIVYGVSSLLEKTAVFLLLPLYTNFLTPADYGIYSILLTFVSLISFISSLGIENGLPKYLIEYDKHSFLSTGFWSGLGISFITVFILFVFAAPVNQALFFTYDYSGVYKLALLIILFDSATRIFVNLIVAEQKSKKFFYLSFFRGTVNILLNIYFLAVLKRGLEGVVEASVISSFFTAVYCFAFSISGVNFSFDTKILKKLLLFGLPLMFTSVFLTLLNFSDRFLVQYFHGAGEAGKYSAAYRLGMVMNAAVVAFNMGALPYITSMLKEKYDEKELFSKILLLLTAVMSAVFLGVEYFLDFVIKIKVLDKSLINPAFYDALGIIPIVLISYIFYGYSLHFNLNIYHKERTNLALVVSIVSLIVNVSLNLILIPIYGYMGAALSNLVSYFMMAALTYYSAAKIFPMKNDWMGVSVISSVCFLFYSGMVIFGDGFLVLRIFLYILFIAVMLFYLKKKEVL